ERKFQVPSSKFQKSLRLQIPNQSPEIQRLELSFWNFFGTWNLEPGTFCSMTALHTILILLITWLAVFGEAAFNGVRHLFGAQVDLLPALVVYASLSANLTTLTLVCVCGGLFFDTQSANPLGVTVLPLFVVGMAIYSKRAL